MYFNVYMHYALEIVKMCGTNDTMKHAVVDKIVSQWLIKT